MVAGPLRVWLGRELSSRMCQILGGAQSDLKGVDRAAAATGGSGIGR